MIAHCEDVQEIRSLRNLRQKIQKPRSIQLPNRPRPSLLAEGNFDLEDDVEIEEG